MTTAVAIVSAVVVGGMVGTAPAAQAQFADGGEGLYPGTIDWFDLGEAGVPVPAEGASRTNTRVIGGNTIETTCGVDNIEGEISTYRSGTYRGDAFDDLYNVGGPDAANTLVAGIANTVGTGGATVSFDFTCEVRVNGVVAPIGGLVVADAESNNAGQGEYIEATPANESTWRVIDRYRTPGCETSTQAILSGDSLRLQSDGQQCSESVAGNVGEGPVAVGFMDGATSAHVEMHGGGVSAVALGVVFLADFGDAPDSYGEAGAMFQAAWSGGEIEEGTTNVSDDDFVLGVPVSPVPRLGETVDSDSGYMGSALADGDDSTGNAISDEDAITPPGIVTTDFGQEYSVEVACTGPGSVNGWVDWNANGTFDESEAAGVAPCENGTVTLTWIVPADAVQTVDSPTFMRLRIAGPEEDVTSPIGVTSSGEVEDYSLNVDLPDPGLTIVKTSDAGESVIPGESIEYTIVVENSGEVAYTDETPATFTDDLSEVLDDATFVDGSAAATSGTVVYDGEAQSLDWSGALEVGASATVTYSVTVNDPLTGDAVLTNVVTGPEESNCATDVAAETEDCQVVVLVRAYVVSKVVDTEQAAPGDVVTYTVEVASIGTAPFTEETPATFVDDLTDVLDDASWNDDATATAGTTVFAEPTLTWSGPLEVDGEVTVTYSVTVLDQDASDGNASMENVVTTPTDGGGRCASLLDCITITPIHFPTPPAPPVPPAPPIVPPDLAVTGSGPVQPLVLWGALLVMIGAGFTVVAATRRSRKRS